ncbi:ent-kaurenoic acid oxidase 2-like [Senna tora]|uniref:Ent-kaurenoic acid oxidase 2-like n=1 Tax=Senna tora TaxID=362788 RepID=A0A834W0C9_9FABA|nr:ent-kaurenoic acid oxidase 2-like [Senna tora]
MNSKQKLHKRKSTYYSASANEQKKKYTSRTREKKTFTFVAAESAPQVGDGGNLDGKRGKLGLNGAENETQRTSVWSDFLNHGWMYECELGEKQYSLPPGDLGWPFIGNMWYFLSAFKSTNPDSFISSYVSRIWKAFMESIYVREATSGTVYGIRAIFANNN